VDRKTSGDKITEVKERRVEENCKVVSEVEVE